MTIFTAETTDRLQRRLDTANNNLEGARQRLAGTDLVADPMRAVTEANKVAYHAGIVYALMTAQQANEAEVEPMRDAMLRLLLSGAEDTWSGRDNDGQRSRHDGIMRGVSTVIGLVATEERNAAEPEVAEVRGIDGAECSGCGEPVALGDAEVWLDSARFGHAQYSVIHASDECRNIVGAPTNI